MGILQLLMDLEQIGCVDIFREQEDIVYDLDERRRTRKQTARLENRVQKIIRENRPLLMKWLVKVQQVSLGVQP